MWTVEGTDDDDDDAVDDDENDVDDDENDGADDDEVAMMLVGILGVFDDEGGGSNKDKSRRIEVTSRSLVIEFLLDERWTDDWDILSIYYWEKYLFTHENDNKNTMNCWIVMSWKWALSFAHAK